MGESQNLKLEGTLHHLVQPLHFIELETEVRRGYVT